MTDPRQIDYDAALARVRAYAEKIRDGERAADRDSLERAADLALLYEDKRWVDELAAEGKAPKTKIYQGRPVDPAAKHRFATWMLSRTRLGPSQTRRLLQANEWVETYRARGAVIPPTERAIRPAYALGRKGCGDDTPKVLARAAEIADGAPLTSEHIKEALSEFWASIPKPQLRHKVLTRKAELLRRKTIADFDLLLAMGAYGDAEEALTVIAQHAREAFAKADAA